MRTRYVRALVVGHGGQRHRARAQEATEAEMREEGVEEPGGGEEKQGHLCGRQSVWRVALRGPTPDN
jgi:hypothetical protein